jgi:predicted permease
MNSALNRVSGRYFETAGIQVVQGRPIAASDTPNGTKIAVVNQTLARRFFPRGGALGHSLTIGMDSVAGPWQIVGVARDTKSGDPRSQDPKMMVYIPLAQIEPFAPGPTGSREQNEDRLADVILLRTTGDPSHRISDLRDAVAQVDPNLPLIKIRTMQQEVSRMMSDDQLISSLTSIFAGLALALAAIGLYGVMSYNVVQRTNEIGVRLAVGAQTNDVLWMVLKDALLLLTIGAALGLPISLAAARIVRHQLFQVRADDPLTYIVALIAVTTGAIISAWLPARRAAAVNPVEALRCE